MDLPLRTISYIADIGNMVVLMARGKMVRSRSAQDNLDQTNEHPGSARDDRRQYRMVCHVFESEDVSVCVFERVCSGQKCDQGLHSALNVSLPLWFACLSLSWSLSLLVSLSIYVSIFLSISLSFLLSPSCLLPQAQLIAQSIGQAFSVAYQEFLRANGIDPEDLSQREYSDLLNTQDMYNDDLIHFSKSENCRDVSVPAGGGRERQAGSFVEEEIWLFVVEIKVVGEFECKRSVSLTVSHNHRHKRACHR